jgi:hypothetical protein
MDVVYAGFLRKGRSADIRLYRAFHKNRFKTLKAFSTMSYRKNRTILWASDAHDEPPSHGPARRIAAKTAIQSRKEAINLLEIMDQGIPSIFHAKEEINLKDTWSKGPILGG